MDTVYPRLVGSHLTLQTQMPQMFGHSSDLTVGPFGVLGTQGCEGCEVGLRPLEKLAMTAGYPKGF